MLYKASKQFKVYSESYGMGAKADTPCCMYNWIKITKLKYDKVCVHVQFLFYVHTKDLNLRVWKMEAKFLHVTDDVKDHAFHVTVGSKDHVFHVTDDVKDHVFHVMDGLKDHLFLDLMDGSKKHAFLDQMDSS